MPPNRSHPVGVRVLIFVWKKLNSFPLVIDRAVTLAAVGGWVSQGISLISHPSTNPLEYERKCLISSCRLRYFGFTTYLVLFTYLPDVIPN